MTTPQRRSLWDTIVNTSHGRNFWSRLVVLILFLLPVAAGFSAYQLWQVTAKIAQLRFENPAIGPHLVGELRSIGFLFLSVIILLCLLAIYFVFFLIVRVYGPQAALLRFIDQLKAGDYSPYRQLRGDDQLKEIWQALQDLAADLSKKKR